MNLWDTLTNNIKGVYYEVQCRRLDARIERMQPMRPGVVIRESRIGYDHYGVYVGEDQVIHFSKGMVRETSLHTFCRMPIKVVDVMDFADHVIKGISLKMSAQRARKLLGKTQYDLTQNNCEHFALWCRTGVAYSSQALGSLSKHYSMGTAVRFSQGSLIGDVTSLFAKNFGMEVSRKVTVGECYDEE